MWTLPGPPGLHVHSWQDCVQVYLIKTTAKTNYKYYRIKLQCTIKVAALFSLQDLSVFYPPSCVLLWQNCCVRLDEVIGWKTSEQKTLLIYVSRGT